MQPPGHGRSHGSPDASGSATSASESRRDLPDSSLAGRGPLPDTQWQPQRPLLPAAPGRVAIIVDDVGYNDGALDGFAEVDFPLTFSVLPQLDDSRRLARACAAAGFEVMLHLPMQPRNSDLDPGPGCVMVEMTDDEIAELVERNLTSVPGAVGANNHMGSLATADERVITAALSVLRRHGLFFVDSLTTGGSVAEEAAAEVGIPYAERSVFLDTNFTPEPTTTEEFCEAAQERVQQLGRIAQRRGSAIGICHYRPQTAQMLGLILPALEESGVAVVSVSNVMSGASRSVSPTRPGAAPRAEPGTHEPARDR
ncbi:MAG: divergent polysaccharide deacetylase family protein [Armatimonadota bacterium]|nr:MAG: divergent polysaccharide deacetylase family protein [Armatimonadota bacterium]